jgi:hypothetical protein
MCIRQAPALVRSDYRVKLCDAVQILRWILHAIAVRDMGRKLNAFEEASFSSPETGVSRQDPTSLSRSQELQHQIASQLGVPVAQLRAPSDLPNAVSIADDPSRGLDTALSRECVDLIEAYTRIKDPAQRLRYLRMVRRAAYGSTDTGPATET